MVAPYRTAGAVREIGGTSPFILDTNAMESIQSQLRRVTRQRGAFPTPESVKKVLFLAIYKISERWSRPIKDWVAALNHFSIVFEGRIAS